MSDAKTLLKTCSSCGKQKPLAAFLQLSGTEGASYGNVCATCRGSHIHKKAITEKDESTRSSSGLHVDSKTKVKSESDKRHHRLEIEERYHEDREEQAEEAFQQLEKKHIKSEKEKDHRKNYIEKQSFLKTSKTPAAPTSPANVHEVAAKERDINLSTPFIDTYISGKLKFGDAYRKFKNLVGTGGTAPTSQQQKKEQRPDKTITQEIEDKWSNNPKGRPRSR